MEPTTRHSLLLRLRNLDDQAAWAEFVEVYEPLVYRIARSRGLQDADAQDLCQDVFRNVAGAIERWDPDPAKGSFRGWLFRIARNLVVNALTAQNRGPRAKGGSSVLELLNAHPNGDFEAELDAVFDVEFQRRAFRWAAEQVRKEFADATWLAFWRTGVERLPVAEVADELRISTGAVYIARSRVLARLRQRVQELTADDDALGQTDCEENDEAISKL